MLPATLESVFAQHYEPVEVIVLDDGSTDKTPDVMKQYENRVRYYRQDNQGISVARTNACRYAAGELIAFIDDDDLMPPERLNTLYSALEQYPEAVFATGDFAIIDDQGRPTGERRLREKPEKPRSAILFADGHEAVLWPRIPATVHTSLFRSKDGQEIGWFNPAYRYASEDKDFFARLGLRGPAVYVPEIVSYYRQGHTSLTRASVIVSIEQLMLFAEHLQYLRTDQIEYRRRLERRLLKTLVEVSCHGTTAIEKMDRDEIRRRISTGIRRLSLRNKVRYLLESRMKRRR